MEGVIIKFVKIIVVFSLILLSMPIGAEGVSITARSAIVINADTLEVLYQSNAQERLSMASTTKIMTGLLLAESGRLDETVCCTKEMVSVEGSSLGLKAGDYITARDLLYGLMLMSGNDAANVTAYFISGSEEAFANLMNDKAKKIGLKDTHFVTPSGLDAEGHYTTAYDLALLTAYALKNSEFKAVCGAYTATIHFGNPPLKYTIKNHNRLLAEYDGCIGVKTGFTKKSGRCLVTAAERDGAKIIAVTLKDPNDWRDHKQLLDYGFSSIVPCKKEVPDKNISVLGGTEKGILCAKPFEIYCKEENINRFSLVYELPDLTFAPIEEGEILGKVCLMLGDIKVAEKALSVKCGVTQKNEKKPSFQYKIIFFIKQIFCNF